MKPTILLLAILMLSLHCLAQKSWVSVTVNEYRQFHLAQTTNDTEDHYVNKALIVLPSVGYYRVFGGNWGIGCEFGYRKFRQENDFFSDFSGEIGQTHYTGGYKEFYFCPTIFEIFTWKKYRASTSLSVPVQYITDVYDNSHSEDKYKSSNIVYRLQDNETNDPDRVILGVFCNAGLQRKIYKNLYAGPQIGFGLIRLMAGGHSHQSTKMTNKGVYSEYILEVEKEKYTDSRFDIRPTFSVSYYF